MTAPAFLALWNGIQAGLQAEYEAWHSTEHMPERLGTPGFLGARRYRAADGDDYFTIYEMETLAALDSPAYAALMHAPTAWSLRMRQPLTEFRRLPCRTLAAQRFGQGGAVATLRVAAPGQMVMPRLRPLMERAVTEGRLLGFMLGEAGRLGQSYEAFPHAPPPTAETLLIAEATEADALSSILRDCGDAVGEARSEAGSWRLLQLLERSELMDPGLPRQLPREDLRLRWSPASDAAASREMNRPSIS
jgi:hypothetical protein